MTTLSEVLKLLIPLWSANVLLNILGFVERKLRIPDRRLDFNIHLSDNQPLLGPKETLLGLPVALLGGLLGALAVSSSAGLLLGFATYAGQTTASFVKRRLKISSGRPLFFVDQCDYLVAAFVCLAIVNPGKINTHVFTLALLITIPVHILTNIFSYFLGVRKNYW